MINICECPPSQIQQIAQSDRIVLWRCSCGQYWLRTALDPAARPATGAEADLAELVAALARIKLPAPVAAHRAPGGRNGKKV